MPLFRHPRSNRARGFFSHNTDIIIVEKDTRCPKCSFTIPRGEPAYRNKEGKFLCAVCTILEMKA